MAAQGGGWAGSGVFLEENAYAPGPTPAARDPLWKFGYNSDANPTLTLSPQSGAWQFLSGSYDWTCGDPQCTTWTDNVIRNVGVGGNFTLVAAPVPLQPLPLLGQMLLLALGGFGLLAYRKVRPLAAGNISRLEGIGS